MRVWLRPYGAHPCDRWAQDVIRPLARNEVRLRWLAAPVNPADLMEIKGTYGVRPNFPAVPGVEGVARVEEVN